MSNLLGSVDSFHKSQANATKRNISHSRPASSTPARVPTPKPKAPVDTTKRTHDSAFSSTAASSTPAAPMAMAPGGAGHEILTNMNYVKKYLKEKFPSSKSFDDILSYLSLDVEAQKNKNIIRTALMQDTQVEVVPKGASGNKQIEFKYRPKVPVFNSDELCTYLNTLDSAAGIYVPDIKDGWPDCIPFINELAAKGQVLVTRGKDDIPKYVYADTPQWHIQVDQDFRDFWAKTKIPAAKDDIRSDLEKAGITPTSQVKENKNTGPKKQKKKPARRGGKVTNTHMRGMLKDYGGR